MSWKSLVRHGASFTILVTMGARRRLCHGDRRFEVLERLDVHGHVVTPLDTDGLPGFGGARAG